jgi:pilus assembly protein CpaB
MRLQISKKFLPLIIAAILGLIATFLVNNYIKQTSEEASKRATLREESLSSVVIAKQDIPSGVIIKESMLKEEKVYRSVLQPKAATSMDRITDKITIAPIAKGEQVLLNKVTVSGQELSLSMKVPAGKRAITIPVDDISSVGGMIRPGDHVDVIGMVPVPAVNAEGKRVNQLTTMPLFQDVLVLAVGQEFTSSVAAARAKKEEKAASSVITFALAPQEANFIIFVQEQGKIRLLLRSPGDAQLQPAAPASWDTLFRAIMPQAFQEPIKHTEAPVPQKKVEIYRGLQKEIKTIE